MGKWFNSTLMHQNFKFKKPLVASTKDREMTKADVEAGDSSQADTASLLPAPGGDEGEPEHHNPVAQDGRQRARRTHKGRVRKARPKRSAN